MGYIISLIPVVLYAVYTLIKSNKETKIIASEIKESADIAVAEIKNIMQ